MKKLFALVLVLALAMSAVAFAEEAPAEAIGSPVPMEITYSDPDVNPALKSAEEDETVGQLLTAIDAADVETVFASAGVEDIAKYELIELVGLTMDGYKPEDMDEVVLKIKFASAFTSDMKLLTLLGLIDGTEVTWQNLEFKVEEPETEGDENKGIMTITFTAEQAEAVANGTAVIAVLEEIAE